jgi:hypothetical protein
MQNLQNFSRSCQIDVCVSTPCPISEHTKIMLCQGYIDLSTLPCSLNYDDALENVPAAYNWGGGSMQQQHAGLQFSFTSLQ